MRLGRYFWRHYLYHPQSTTLDVHAELFHTLAGCTVDQFVAVEGSLGTFYSNVTSTMPCLVHGCGGSKKQLRFFVEALERTGYLSKTEGVGQYSSDIVHPD